MALLKVYTHSKTRGFTLIEILTVIGVIVLLASMPLLIDLTSYRIDAFRAERDEIVTLLQKARADALNNIHESAHGVALFPTDHPNSYVVFEGANYAASNSAQREVHDAVYASKVGASSPREVVFNQLDGSANVSGEIVIVDPQRAATSTIEINREGGISW